MRPTIGPDCPSPIRLVEKESMENDSGDDECMGPSLIAAAAKALSKQTEGGEAALKCTKGLLHLDTHWG